jgi:VWFA-related protein
MRTLIRRPAAVVASMLASLAVLAAQTTSSPPPAQGQPPQQQTPPPQQPTFRARVDSVSVDVIVTDRQGNPVTDLKAEDFDVRESGKPQKVDSFKFITIDDARDQDPASFRQILSMSEQQRETASDLNRIFVILLDDYHVRRGNGMRVREQLATFVSNLTPRDLVAVLYPLTPINATTFSRHHSGTAQAIMQFDGRKYDYTPRNAYEERYQMMPPQTQEQMRNDLVISALQGACSYLGTLREGRKTLLYVSEGMTGTLPPGVNTTGTMFGRGATSATPENVQFFNSADLLMRMRDVFTAATRANAAIYTLDPRGLASEEFDIADRVDSQTSRRMFTEATDLLRVISDQTDGRAIVGRNDPFPELQRMVRDSSAYYLLGYTSTVAARDGKFHEIQVRVKRPNVEVRARKGYWAMSAEDAERASAPPKPGPARDVADALESLAAVVEPTSRKPVTVWMGATRGTGEKAALTLAWETTASAATDPSDAADHINITAQTIGGEMLFKGAVARDPQLAIPGGRVTFDAPAGPVRVRVISEGVKNNRLDSEDVSYDVPDFTTPGPTITTPVVFRARTARDVQVLKAAALPVPTAKRAFSRTERIYFRFDAYGPAGTTPTIAMRLLNSRGDSMAALPPPATREGSTFEAEFSLGPLPPGDYLIEIAATSGSDTSRTLLAVRITG